ncbi:MAG TPA: glycosyltransferase family 87 protein [Ktedonobacterales bacterium]
MKIGGARRDHEEERRTDRTHRDGNPSQRARLRRIALIYVMCAVLAEWAVIVGFATQLAPPHVSDFGMYYAAAILLRHNPQGAIYASSALLDASTKYGGCPQLIPPQYVYPPLLAIVLEPLTFIPCAQALVVWTAGNALLLMLTAVMLVQFLRWERKGDPLATWAIVIVSVVAFWPMYPGLFLGQTHILVLFLMTSSVWLEERRRPWLSGLALVCAAMIKPLPALLLVYYLARGRWKVVGGALAGGIALLVIMMFGSSPATVTASLAAALQSTSFQAHPGQDEALSVVAGPAGVALVAAAIVSYLAVILVRKRGDITLGAAWTLCSMLVLSPVVWSFYLVWLLPAFAICLRPSYPPSTRRAAYYALLAALYLVLATPFLFLARPFATLALWALCGALYWRSGRPGPSALVEPALT